MINKEERSDIADTMKLIREGKEASEDASKETMIDESASRARNILGHAEFDKLNPSDQRTVTTLIENLERDIMSVVEQRTKLARTLKKYKIKLPKQVENI